VHSSELCVADTFAAPDTVSVRPPRAQRRYVDVFNGPADPVGGGQYDSEFDDLFVSPQLTLAAAVLAVAATPLVRTVIVWPLR